MSPTERRGGRAWRLGTPELIRHVPPLVANENGSKAPDGGVAAHARCLMLAHQPWFWQTGS